jgi:sugar-specific transcriptional regulator TrmB
MSDTTAGTDQKRAPEANRELDEYRALVTRLMQEVRRDAKPRAFRNKGTEHAQIVIDTMLDSADRSICIFAQEMSREVFSSEKVKAFLTRHPEGLVSVVVENPTAQTSSSSALNDLHDEIASGRVSVVVAKNPPHDRNVCIVDGIHVRLEKNQARRMATVVFGDSALGNTAVKFFDAIRVASSVRDPSLASAY